MTQIQFDPSAWRSGGGQMMSAGDTIASQSQSFLGAVSDPSVFGGNDILGSVASMIYGLVIERMGGCLDTLSEGYGTYGDLASQTGDAYAELEANNVELSGSIEEGL